MKVEAERQQRSIKLTMATRTEALEDTWKKTIANERSSRHVRELASRLLASPPEATISGWLIHREGASLTAFEPLLSANFAPETRKFPKILPVVEVGFLAHKGSGEADEMNVLRAAHVQIMTDRALVAIQKRYLLEDVNQIFDLRGLSFTETDTLPLSERMTPKGRVIDLYLVLNSDRFLVAFQGKNLVPLREPVITTNLVQLEKPQVTSTVVEVEETSIEDQEETKVPFEKMMLAVSEEIQKTYSGRAKANERRAALEAQVQVKALLDIGIKSGAIDETTKLEDVFSWICEQKDHLHYTDGFRAVLTAWAKWEGYSLVLEEGEPPDLMEFKVIEAFTMKNRLPLFPPASEIQDEDPGSISEI